jgi:flagellar protein FliS
MLKNQAYRAYHNDKITTASPAELTLMLYEGAIRFCNQAIAAIGKNDIQGAHNNIRKVEKIIMEFQSTLNDKYEVAQDFHKVYDYMLSCLRDANTKKNAADVEECAKHLRTMRDTWKEVMRLNATASNKVSAS